METKCVFVGVPCILVLMIMSGFAKSDLAKDREQCSEQLVGLATCLPYVGGDAKAPTLDCCSGIKQVLQKGKICICILVKDRNDPNLGIKINATLALGLPHACHAPANISDCTSLLHLAPNSTEAKVFEDFANSSKGSTSAPITHGKGNASSIGSSVGVTSDGGRGKKWLGIEMAWDLLITLLFQILTNL